MRRLPVCAALIACSMALGARAEPGESGIELRAAAGRDIAVNRCVTCHSLDYIEMNAEVMDRAGWQKTIRKMIDRFGAPITEEEAGQILDYLDANYSVRT